MTREEWRIKNEELRMKSWELLLIQKSPLSHMTYDQFQWRSFAANGGDSDCPDSYRENQWPSRHEVGMLYPAENSGDSDWIRTNDLLLRRQLLYPAELRNQNDIPDL